MEEVQIFSNAEFGEVRTLTIDGEPWFVGRDVATILGYSNPRDAIRKHVDDEDKGVAKCDTLGGNQELVIINESGLYSLILSSKLPTAKQFKRWVTNDVLPSIRKHGGYLTQEMRDKIIADPDILIQLATELKEERAKSQALALENSHQKQMIAEFAPKVTYYDIVLQTPDAIPISQIAKDYGKSAKWFSKKLHELGIQYRQGNTWLLYQKHAEGGYTKSKTHVYQDEQGQNHSVLHTNWTQKGRLFLYETLKRDGILPLVEQDVDSSTAVWYNKTLKIFKSILK